jgi:phage terminase large subunit
MSGMQRIELPKVKFPGKFACLFEDATPERGRYKVFYGGRGSLKTWTFARALLIKGAKKKRRDPLLPSETENSPVAYRVLCTREVQDSIKESVYQTLVDQITRLGLGDFYDVKATEIVGKKGTTAEGTEFIFKGLHDVMQLKSYEGIDIVWVEEGNKVAKVIWETVIPTIRREYADGTCSEIWVSFNPELEDDEAYRRFVVLKNRPKNAIVVEVSYKDHPEWFPKVLQAEMETLKQTDYDAYLTVYEGKTRQTLEGAIFAKELRAARAKGRICRFEIEAGHPINTFWDLGRSDYTSIWFIQRVGLQWRVVDFYQNRLEHIDHYIGILQTKGYVYHTHFLPHDGKAKQLGTKRTVEEQLRGDDGTGEPLRRVRIVKAQALTDQHNALRSLFPNMYFHEDNCSQGLSHLGRYCYEINPVTKQFSKTPKHDDNSHAASALLQFGMAATEPERKKRAEMAGVQALLPTMGHPQGWLGQ